VNWNAIARKDVRDAARSRSVWALLALFLVLFLGLTYAVSRVGDADFDAFLETAVITVSLLVPLVAVVLGYKAVISERESGSLALLLSLPHSRRDVVIGKFLGRSVVLVVPVVVGTVAAGVLAAVLFGSFEPGSFLLFVGLTALLGLAFLGVGVGLSMSTTAQRRVTAGAFGAYLLFVVLWSDLVSLLVLILFRFQQSAVLDPPDWAVLLELATPTTAFEFLAAELLGTAAGVPTTGSSEPWFVEPWVALVLLVGWIVAPLLVGYWRFETTDL